LQSSEEFSVKACGRFEEFAKVPISAHVVDGSVEDDAISVMMNESKSFSSDNFIREDLHA
jgi:hypothetical protein